MINGSSSTTNYHHNYIYNVDGLQQINTEEGRVLHDPVTGDFDHQYFIKDHLGNVRVVFGSPAKHQEKVLEQHHYYPYGMEFMGLEHGTYTLSNKYRFQGKELQDEHNLYWHDLGARMYDNQLGRWHCTDPAEQFNSPYQAMGNNPVNMIDPNGMVSIGFRAWWIDYVNATGDCANLWYLQSQEVDRLQNLALQVSIYEMGLEEEQQDSKGGMGSTNEGSESSSQTPEMEGDREPGTTDDSDNDVGDYANELKEHYEHGNGTEYVLSQYQLLDLFAGALLAGAIDRSSMVQIGTDSYDVSVNYYDTNLDLALAIGRATMTIYVNPSTGKISPQGFNDTWNLDAKDWEVRPYHIEIVARCFNLILDGESFSITYP